MAKAKEPSPPLERPILIDEADGRCEICASHVVGKCDNCGNVLDPKDSEMRGAGYQSVKPTHFHLRTVGGSDGPAVPGREVKFAELCYKCHREDRKKVYGKSYGEAGL